MYIYIRNADQIWYAAASTSDWQSGIQNKKKCGSECDSSKGNKQIHITVNGGFSGKPKYKVISIVFIN